MAFEELTPAEQAAVLECLQAVADGPFLDDIEFHTLLGHDREALRGLVRSFPTVDDHSDSSPASLLINNCLNLICYGIPVSETQWRTWFTVTQERSQDVYRRWAKLKGYHNTGIR